MNTRVQKAQKSQKTQGSDQDTHECFMNVSDPSVWMDNSNDLVSFVKRLAPQKGAPASVYHMKDYKEVQASVQLRFIDGGESSSLGVWSANGERSLGYLEGEELVLFLTRALARLNHRTTGNSRSMSSPLAADRAA